MTSCFLIFSLSYKWKENNFEHNRIVSGHKAFVSSTNVNCLISKEVQHEGVNMYFCLLKVGPAEKRTDLWLTLNVLPNRASQKTSSNLSKSKTLTWKGPITAQFSDSQFYLSRDLECSFTNKLIYSIGNPASSLHNKVCFFFTPSKLTYAISKLSKFITAGTD